MPQSFGASTMTVDFFSKGSLALGTRLDFTNYTSLLESAVPCIVVLALCCTFRAENVLRALS